MATSKSKTKTLRSQYTEILEKKNTTLAECRILGFKFPSLNNAHAFHYDLITSECHYLIYDGVSPNVKVVISRHNDENEEDIIRIAEKHNGEKYTPTID